MSDRQAAELRGGCYEWVDCGNEGAFAHLERAAYVIVQARGDFEAVSIRGTLFDEEDAPEVELCRLTQASSLDRIPEAPSRIRPVVFGRKATIRLYAPKG